MPRLSISTTAAPARRQSSFLASRHRVLRRAVRQAHAERFDRAGHRVGGVHAAARARARESRTTRWPAIPGRRCCLFACAPTASNTDTMSSLRRVARDAAGQDRAAVNKHRRPVQPRHGDQRAGHVLVATADRDEPVHAFAADDRLDRVGDDLARDQRILHPFGAHRDAVGDGDRVENNRLAAGVVGAGSRLRARVCRCACCTA